MIGSRSAWMAARARNAARRGGWIALAGAVAVALTVAALILLPRAADRQLEQRLAAIAPAPDSLPLVRRIDSVQRVRASLDAPPPLPTASLDSIRSDSSVSQTSARGVGDLPQRIAQARQSMLPENFRALGADPLLRVNARVAPLLDSIDRVDREREAHAALGGPGARYAALTTRLATLGQRLLALADSSVRAASTAASTTSPGVALKPPRSAAAQRLLDSVAAAAADSARRAQAVQDSLRDELRAAADRRYALDTVLLTALRQQHARAAAERAQLESTRAPTLPKAGVALAALIIGLAAGFSLVLLSEVRRPTVGDLDEVRRVTGAAVLVHDASRRAGPRAAARSGTTVSRPLTERPGVPKLIDRESDTFTVLHLALSGVGDLVEQVDVLSDRPIHAAAVALSTAAVAASESRAVLVFAGAADSVLPTVVGAAKRASVGDAADLADAALHELTIDRDTHIDVLLAPPPSETARDRLLDRYDLRFALPVAQGDTWAPSRDVVLVARRGYTTLSWLTDGVRRAQAREQRIRAVVLWSRPRPRV